MPPPRGTSGSTIRTRTAFLLSDGDAAADLEGVELVDLDVADVIVLGGASADFTYTTMNRIFGRLMDGATLVGMHRNLYWRTNDGLELDAGAYIAGLEEATGREAVICGKPSGPYFDAALALLGVPREGTIMVGDDIVNDVRGAQVLGLRGVLVRTGKFLPDDLAKVRIRRTTCSRRSPTSRTCWACPSLHPVQPPPNLVSR